MAAARHAILIAIALVAVAWFLSIVIRFALSRSREFLADAGAVELTKNPDAMIMALRKIEGRGELPGVNSAVMEMCIDNPRRICRLFATHPSIDSGVDALVKMAGGHDPGPLALATAAEQAVGEEGHAEQPEESPWSGEADQEGETAADRTSLPHLESRSLGRAAPEAGPWGRPRAPWGMRKRHFG